MVKALTDESVQQTQHIMEVTLIMVLRSLRLPTRSVAAQVFLSQA
jgi:hypothetical protein